MTLPPINFDLQTFLFDVLSSIGGAAVVLLAGRWLAGFAKGAVHKFLVRARATPALTDIIERGTYYGIMLVAIAWALVLLGIPPELLLMVVVGIFLAASVAMRESLRDLAATVLFIIFQPFKPGDYIETNGVAGQVQEILLFNTMLTMPDNRQLIVPNSSIQNSNLINYSVKEHLRLDLPVTVGYADDLALVRGTLLELAKQDKRVLPAPLPGVDVIELGDNGVKVVLHVFVKPADYGALRPALNEQIKIEFDQRHITFPFPQLELHMSENSNPDPRRARIQA